MKSFKKQCDLAAAGGKPLFRDRGYERLTRRKKKLMLRESWHKPQNDIVGFFAPTPGGKLVAGIQQIVRVEGQKIVLNIKVTEQSGTKIGALLTSTNLVSTSSSISWRPNSHHFLC